MEIRLGVNLNFAKYVHERKEALRIVREELDVDCVEMVPDIGMGAAWFLEDEAGFRAYHREVGRIARDLGIEVVSVQTFFRENAAVSSAFSGMREAAFAVMRSMAAQAGECGAHFFGGHFGSYMREEEDDPTLVAELTAHALDYWAKMTAVCRREGLDGVNVETMSTTREYCTIIDGAKEILDNLNGRRAKDPDAMVPAFLCYDTGHGATRDEAPDGRDRSMSAWFRAFADEMVEVHLKQTDAEHMAVWPFTDAYAESGIIDLDDLVAGMRKYLRAPVVYLILEITGKRGRRLGEDRTLAGIRESVQRAKAALA